MLGLGSRLSNQDRSIETNEPGERSPGFLFLRNKSRFVLDSYSGRAILKLLKGSATAQTEKPTMTRQHQTSANKAMCEKIGRVFAAARKAVRETHQPNLDRAQQVAGICGSEFKQAHFAMEQDIERLRDILLDITNIVLEELDA